MESEKNWYVIHTYSGYEKKVKDNLERKVRSMGLENVIERILVPEEDEIDVKDGRKRTVRRKIYPGYVFVEMEVNDRSWYVVTLKGLIDMFGRETSVEVDYSQIEKSLE